MLRTNKKNLIWLFVVLIWFFSFFYTAWSVWITWDWIRDPDASLEKRFWNTTYTISWIEAYKDSYLWNKYWEVNPSWKDNWEWAKVYCSNLWTWWWRLPTIEELYSITTYKARKNKNDIDVFSIHPWISSTHYWSSTSSANITTYAWDVNFGYAYTNDSIKPISAFIVCIHD